MIEAHLIIPPERQFIAGLTLILSPTSKSSQKNPPAEAETVL